jgi:hypothetical protein
MTSRDVALLRLANQGISSPIADSPAAVVASLLAMQAQDYGGALWSIGLRLADATRAQVEAAIAGRQVVRTWPMRGTLHFVAAPDVRWMLQLLTPRVIAASATRQKRLGLDGKALARCEKALVRALGGGRQLVRDEVYAVIERTGITTDGYRGYHVVWRLAQERVLCFGPHAGKQPTFALLDEWVPASPLLGREEALARLALRYFAGHGPATAHDLAWWSGLKVSDVKAAIESVGDELVKGRVGEGVYVTSAAASRAAPAAGGVHLLPGFDELLLGYRDRAASLDRAHAGKILPGGNGVFMPTIVSKGRVVGTWRAAVRKGKAEVAPAPFAPLSAREVKGCRDAAGRYSRFLGLQVSAAADRPSTRGRRSAAPDRRRQLGTPVGPDRAAAP